MKIPFSPPDISETEINEVVKALKSGWITTGPRVKLLERRLAAYIETGRTDIDCDTDEAKSAYGKKVVYRQQKRPPENRWAQEQQRLETSYLLLILVPEILA